MIYILTVQVMEVKRLHLMMPEKKIRQSPWMMSMIFFEKMLK